MAEGINIHKIIIETKDTSDPKKAERIKKHLDDPTYVSKNREALRKEIGSMSSEAGTKVDDSFVRQATRRLISVSDNVAKTSIGLAQKGKKQPKQTQETVTKETKEAARETKEAAIEIKKAAKELGNVAKELGQGVKGKKGKGGKGVQEASKEEDALAWESTQGITPKPKKKKSAKDIRIDERLERYKEAGKEKQAELGQDNREKIRKEKKARKDRIRREVEEKSRSASEARARKNLEKEVSEVTPAESVPVVPPSKKKRVIKKPKRKVVTFDDYVPEQYDYVEELPPGKPQVKRPKKHVPITPEQQQIPSRKPTGKEASLIDSVDLTKPLSFKIPMSVVDKASVEPIPGQKKQKIPKTAETQSLIESSDVLMSQIQKDFIRFKTKFAKSVKSHLASAHGEAFKVVGPAKAPYTRRGGVDVLKIADMNKLTSILRKLTSLTEKEILALKEQGPGAMIKEATGPIMERMRSGAGGGPVMGKKQSVREITDYINKHGYQGLDKNVKKLVDAQKGAPVEEAQIKKFLSVKPEGAKRSRIDESALNKLLSETSGRSYMMRGYLGEAVSEVEVPRPQKGPQGFPTVKAPSGRHRALAPEYEFTPGIMVAMEEAKSIIGARGATVQKGLPEIDPKSRKVLKEGAPRIKEMLLGGEKENLASLSSSIMDVMKTNKRGRTELIKAYQEVIPAKGGKKEKKEIPKTKEAQLKYLDELSNKAKRLSIGFDDILVAMGKFSKTGIYDRILAATTKETPGKTAAVRTTAQALGQDPIEAARAVKTFNARIRQPFKEQELVEEDMPRLPWYQSKATKLSVPKLAPREEGAGVPGAVAKAELVAQNLEVEKFLAIKRKGPSKEKYPEALTSRGIAEGRATTVVQDTRDTSRVIANVFADKIQDYSALGKWINPSRPLAPTYRGRGGGTTLGGEIKEELEVPLLMSEKGRATQEAGMWGKGGFGLNLQTEIRDTAGNFEDQIEVAGKAVNRFATYIKPKIKDVKDVGGAEIVAKDIVAQFAPEVGKSLRMKEPGKAAEGTTLITEISKILTGPAGENLNTRAIKIVEMIFTKLGTKMTTQAGSKGTVTFGTGKKGELGYKTRQTEYHELIQETLKKKGEAPGTSKKAKKDIDALIMDLDMAGTAPFVGCMHKNLSKELKEKFKKIRERVNSILDFDVPVTTEKGVSAERQTEALTSNIAKMKKTLGPKAMFKTLPTEVRMSLTGAIKRLNPMEPLEAMVNNVAGNVKGAIDPELSRKDFGRKGEFAQTLQAFGYGWGPEEKLPMEERTLPGYTGRGKRGSIVGQKFWQYPREPEAQEEWSGKDIETGRKGQKLNIAAMSALMSVFGEESATVKEAIGGYKPSKGKAIENIMALKSLGEEPLPSGVPYIPTTGMRELPGVITKHEELRDTVLDPKKFGAGGFVKVPEFEEGKEVGQRPLYVPSRESLGIYRGEGEGASANKLSTLYNSLLTNVEKYEKVKKTKFTKEDKPDVGDLRKSVKAQIGKTTSTFRDFLTKAQSGKAGDALSGEDLNNLITYFKKTQAIIEQSVKEKDPALAKMKTKPAKLIGKIKEQVGILEGKAKGGEGVSGWKEVKNVKGLLLNIKDNLLEPKIDTEGIKRAEADLKKVKSGAPLTSMSRESYYFAEKKARQEGKFEEFEGETPAARERVIGGLTRFKGVLEAGVGKHGLLAMGERPVVAAAEQFGITTDPKERALQQAVGNIERDKRRLKEALVETTIGKEKGIEQLQTGKVPAISGTLSAAINTKVEDFKEAANVINNLSEKGILGDPSDVKSLGNTLVNSVVSQTEKHEKAVEKGRKAGRVVLKEGEVGLPAGKLEKLKGDYGEFGSNLLEATRAGLDVPVVTTRFPMTGVASHQAAIAREVTHPSGRGVISLPGAAPGIDAPELEGVIEKLKKRRTALREERAETVSAKPGTAKSKELDAKRAELTKNILELSKAIDLVTVKFAGFAQNADVDGDTLMVHAGKTKEAQKEIAGFARTSKTGMYGKEGALDPRAFINQMMNYNIAGNKRAMSELAGLYTKKSGVAGAKLFQTPDITREMKGLSFGEVEKGLLKFGITLKTVTDTAVKKGFTKPAQVETVAREMLYEETRGEQLGKIYVKAGLGESTESVNRLARVVDASVGFGEKQITKKEYKAWKPESVALGAVYGKGGALTQKAKPAREMQTMMSVLLEQVINAGMSAKHGGKPLFETVSKGMVSGTLFETMQKDPKTFGGILKSNEIIKTTIRDRMDALSSEDYLAEVKRYRGSIGADTKKTDTELLASRKAVTEGFATRFSFKGFLDDTSKDLQGQIKKTMADRLVEQKGMPREKAEESAQRSLTKQMAKGGPDLGMYFPQMQKAYSLRTSSASVEGLAKQVATGKTTLDRAMTRILDVVRTSGEGVTLSDTMMQSSFKSMFDMFRKAEKLGVNLDKLFKKGKTLGGKKRIVGRVEKVLGMPAMSSVEKELIRKEGAEKFIEKHPEASKEDIAKEQERYLLTSRKKAIRRHVEATAQKKELFGMVAPGVVEREERRLAEKAEYVKATKTEQERKRKIPSEKPLMLPRFSYGYISEPDVPIPGRPLEEVSWGGKEARVRRKGKAGIIAGKKPVSAEVKEATRILGGGVKGVSYSINAKDSEVLIKILNEYTASLNKLLKRTGTLTEEQVKKAQEALSFVKQSMGKLKQVPAGTAVGKVAGKLRDVYAKVGEAGLTDFAARAGVDVKGEKEKVTAVQEQEKKKKVIPSKYKTELQALAGLVGKAGARIGLAPEGMPEEVMNVLGAVREKAVPPEVAPELLKVAMKDVPYQKQAKVWSQYHLEKVRGELDIAQAAEEGGDVAGRETAIGRAKAKILSSYGTVTSPFLEREGRGPRGRTTGYIDEEAVAKLGVYRVPQQRERVAESTKHISKTAGAAIEPLLLGTGRMEERLKSMWSIVRGFNSELAKSGKYAEAFNFERAEADLAIIKSTLKGFQSKGQFSPEEYSDLEHAIRQVTKAEKAFKETPEKGLPSLAIPGLETTETAEAAFENQIAANVKEMQAQKDLAIGETRKVVAKIPTGEGLFEKRQVSLVARGAKEGIVAPGVVGGIERVEGKPVAGKEVGVSRRSVRLIKEFELSTKTVNEKIKSAWLGLKRFDSVAGSVNFDEALKDLADMHMLVNQILKNPALAAEKHVEFSQLKRKLGTAMRTVAETAPEALPGVVMKGMETPESAKVAFKSQIALQKEAMWEDMSLAVGKTMTVAATMPTAAGVAQKRQVQLRAVGEGGVVTGIEEVEYRTGKEYAKELGKGKKTRAGSLVKEFIEGSGDVNSRISAMVLGVKKFDEGLSKAGKHTKAINFDNAEKDLIGIIRLLDEALKGAVHLTEEERAAATQARSVAKAMHQKVTKVPVSARKGISMGGYETPESSLAAHRAKIEQETQRLIKANERGKSVVVKSKLMTETGEERPVSKRLTARGSSFFGFGGPVSRVSEREEVGGGQVGSVIRRVAMWGAASGVIYGVLGGVRQMIETMKQAETGLVNLKKVMSHVTTDFDHMRDSAVRFAKDYGAELMSVLETMRIFAQQGLPQEQVKEMARVSTLAANVTTMKPPEAAEALTSATRQFNIEGEKSIAILDSWNEVENKFAITAKDLADGFKKAGTAAKITGIDVHKLNGIITSIGEATRQTGKEVGTSLKFIFSRMATEKAPRALTAVGVETIEGGRLREGSAILDDLAVKWVGLTRSQKLATAQAIGGIRHYNALMVMMDNYDRALAATAASINSVGSAEKENAMIMETYEKKAAQMKASFDALAVSAGGPILGALKKFADTLKTVLEVMSGIPSAGLATGGALAYGGATALGKYFDLSMFGLLGAGVGGAKRKVRGPKELFTAAFGGKEEIGRAGAASFAGGTRSFVSSFRTPKEDLRTRSKWGREDIARRAVGRSGGVSLGPFVPPVPPVTKLDLVKKGFKGIWGAVKTVFFSVTGLIASLGTLGKIVIPLAILGAAFFAFGKSVSKTFASAKDRTKDYVESLDAVEERLNAIGSIKLLRTRIEIETKRIGALEARTPEQRAAQIEGRSYKSPILMRKQQIENVKEYASAVVALTSEGVVGFDKFGKAVVSSTEELGRVVDKLEAIGSRARLELKLHIEKEELEDLVKAPEIDTWIKVIHYKFRELLERMGKEWGTGWLGKYADKMRNPFEAVLHSMQEINKLRREAGAYGEIIAPPSEKLKEKDPEKYERVKKRFDEYSKAQSEHLVATRGINEKFLEVRRDFFTLSGPGMTTEMAGTAAFGGTGRLLAEIERERETGFYTERGATTEDIQASFFQRLQGINIRATAEITREAAAEQGIPFRPAETMEERGTMLESARAKDVLMFKKEADIQGGMASVFEKNGELWVRYAEQVVKEGEKQLVPVEQTLAQFKEMPKYAEQFVGAISSMGMLTPTQMRLRAISRVSAGAEAGMFRPTKARRLDLGKKYLYQAPTEMLIQNDAFKTFSKTTVAFVNDYIKKQNELRRQQKAALGVYEKRGAIAGETATQVELLTAELVKLSNVAMQSIRIHVELEKSLDQLNVSSAKQAAVQRFRSENLRHLTGPMAGAPVLRTPKIDLRGFFDLTPHERLTVESKKYVSNVRDYNTTMDKYNVATKKGELGMQALADIDYVEGLAKQGVDFGNIEELSKKISKTGDLGSAQIVSELTKQTVLGQQTVSNLSNIASLLGGGTGAYAKAVKMPYGIDRKVAMSSAMETIKTEISLALSEKKYGKVAEIRGNLREINENIVKEGINGGAGGRVVDIEMESGFRALEGDINRGMSSMLLEQLSVNPEQIKKYVVGSKLLTGEGFEERREAGTLKEVIEGRGAIKEGELNIVAIERFIETLTTSGKDVKIFGDQFKEVLGPISKPTLKSKVMSIPGLAEFRLGGIKAPEIVPKLTEPGGGVSGLPIPQVSPAEYVKGEAKGKIEAEVSGAGKKVEELGDYLTRLGLPIRNAQKAIKLFEKASGNLEKTVANLTSTFRDLERQSIVNQKLIETRSKYLSTRGGPMRQRAPSVDIDVATTAEQYSPHQVLYEKSNEYKSMVTGYLSTAETLKAARSKVEEIAKIRGKAEFMETQGFSKERIDSIVSTALKTGSMETALTVSELEKANIALASIDSKTADETGSKKEELPKEQKVYKSLAQHEAEAERDRKTAEAKSITQANYLSRSQIREKTRIDVAVGRGQSQDQINREESGWMAKFGYIPTEIKARNKKLLEVYEAEKEARATFELEKRKILEPLQQSVSGMKSIIDSIKTGVTGIEGARNIRPLEEDFGTWSERNKVNKELVADRAMQFNLAKSLYSQNLNLRAQGADTGVAPRRLYDIMEKASKGEDITKDLEALQPMLKEAVEKRETQIRKLQAEEYARAVSNSEGTKKSNDSLSSINENTKALLGKDADGDTGADKIMGSATSDADRLIISAKENTTSIVSAVNAAQKISTGEISKQEVSDIEKIQKVETKPEYVYVGAGTGEIAKVPAKEHQFGMPVDEEGKIYYSREPDETSTEQKREDVARRDIKLNYGKDKKDYTSWGAGRSGEWDDEYFRQSELKRQAGDMEKVAGLTVIHPDKGESMSDFEARMAEQARQERTIEMARSGIEITPESEEAKKTWGYTRYDEKLSERKGKDYFAYSSEPLTDEKMGELDKSSRRQDAIREQLQKERRPEKEDEKSENLKKKTLNQDTKQSKESKKENNKLNDEISGLKDEVVNLKSAVSDVSDEFKKLGENIENVGDLGDKSKDSAVLVETLGEVASKATASLDTLSSKASTVGISETGTGPTAEATGEGFEYISEEDAINMVNDVREELSERIVELSDESVVVEELVEKTTMLSDDVRQLKEGMLVAPEGGVSIDNFNDFKEEVFSYFETIEELKELTDNLNEGMTINTASVLGLESGFELINKKLIEHNNNLSKLQEGLDFMDHKFTDSIYELKDSVADAMDMALSAYSMATIK